MLLLILSMTDPVKQEILLDLYLNYRTRAIAVAFQILQNRAEAEDVVQEVFTDFYNDPSKLKEKTAKENWPYVEVTIKNRCKNHIRDNKRIQLVEDYEDVEPEIFANQENVDLAELLSTQEFFERATRAIMNLPDIYKDVILLRYKLGLSDEEISLLLKISITNVRVRIHRALKMLEKIMRAWAGGEYNGR